MCEIIRDENGRVIFTKEMKKEYKILMPQMAPFHFDILKEAIRLEGYDIEVLNTTSQNLIHEGLKYVHNDTCVPALFVIGQMIDAIKNGGYDQNKIALIITQTGGGCRASNYIHLLRKALKKSGFENIPVISFNISKLENNPGFQITMNMMRNAINGVLYGDLLMQLVNEVRPYEVNKGEAMEKYHKWVEIINHSMDKRVKGKKKIRKELIEDFATIKRNNKVLPKVGVVGEIYVKFSPLGNNNLEQYLLDEECEVVIPPMTDFLLFKLDYRALEVDLYGGKKLKKMFVKMFMKRIKKRRDYMRKHLIKNGFHAPIQFADMKELVKGYVHHGNRMGEGWLLTAEMIELIKMGVPNIVCTQPFGCLPNHISGKGMFKKIKQNHPEANIVPIDYDTSASEVNQINRIKLMVSNARKNLKKD